LVLDSRESGAAFLSLQHVHVTDSSDTNHVRETNFCTGLLPRAGLTTQLAHNLGDLADTCGTDRMAHRNQTSRRADRAASTYIECPFLQFVKRSAIWANAQSLNVFDFLDSERIVQLDDVEIRRFAPCFVERNLGGLFCEHCIIAGGIVIDALAATR